MFVHTPTLQQWVAALAASKVPYVQCVLSPNRSKSCITFQNGGASDLGGAGYAQDGSLAGCKLTPRYRGTVGAGRRVCFQIQRYTGLATGRVTPRSQDIKPPFGALEWSREYRNRRQRCATGYCCKNKFPASAYCTMKNWTEDKLFESCETAMGNACPIQKWRKS